MQRSPFQTNFPSKVMNFTRMYIAQKSVPILKMSLHLYSTKPIFKGPAFTEPVYFSPWEVKRRKKVLFYANANSRNKEKWQHF